MDSVKCPKCGGDAKVWLSSKPVHRSVLHALNTRCKCGYTHERRISEKDMRKRLSKRGFKVDKIFDE